MKLNKLAIALTCMGLFLGSGALAQTKTSKTRTAAKARTTATGKKAIKKNATTPKSTTVVKAPACDLALFGVKGKVKTIRETDYGLVKNLETMVAELTPSHTVIYTFTEDGFLSGAEMVLSDLETPKPTYKRDANGKLLSYTKEGYDDLGEPRMETTVFKRDAAGNLINVNTTDASDKTYVIWNRKITLLPDGKISKIKHTTEYDNWTEVYKYSPAGDLIKTSNVSPIETFTTTYKYKADRDANGNWIKRNTNGGDETVREIEYYQ